MTRFALLVAFVVLQLLSGEAAEQPQPEFPRFETSQSRVVLNSSRGYRDVLVAIGEYVAEDADLIQGIRDVFTDFSAFLFSATNEYGKGVFLEEVRILIPDTWGDDPTYESRVWESFALADIQVDHPPNSLPNANQPATNKPTQCGAPGFYIHLTPDYITSDAAARPYGNRNSTLTHEWAHYRWGVFDEYPTEGYPHFYAGENGQPEATKCVSAIRGLMRANRQLCQLDASMLPEEDCRFFDDPRQTGTYEGSLMYKQFLPEMRTFCDNSSHTSNPAITHNAMAPNEQNNLCNTKSIWEVLREHDDFRGASGSTTSPAPSFRLIKRKESRSPVVIVLDVSGSMQGQKLHIVRQASYNLITRVLNDGQVFGAVVFNDRGRTVITPQQINSGDRVRLTSLLPTMADGGTSLAAGLREGIRALDMYAPGAQGAEMIALTDGKTNGDESAVTNAELGDIRVHTIAIGPQAEPNLEQLAMRTRGRTFLQSEESAALFNIFTKLAIQDDSGTLTIFSESFNLTVETVRPFSVDSFSAGEMTILIGFPQSSVDSYSVRVVKPNGDVIDANNGRPTDSFQVVDAFDLVQINTESTAGDWEVRVTPLPSVMDATLMGTMHVETKRRVQTGVTRPTIPIQAGVLWALASMEPSQIQTVTVTVHQGYTPISGAAVDVLVVGDSATVPLTAYDDGLGADVRPNDGVYSAFFTQFSGLGRYSLQVTVRGEDGVTKLLEGARVGQGLAAYDTNLLPEFRPKAVDTGSFERSIEGDSFQCLGVDCQGIADLYTPFRVRDLRAVRGENLTAVLSFSATGDDLDYGTADHYEIRMSDTPDLTLSQYLVDPILEFVPEEMRGNGTTPPYVILGDPSSPKESREKETFHVKLPREGDFSYIFTVVAVDDQGQKSQPSNLASVTAMPAAVPSTIVPVPTAVNDAMVSTTPGGSSLAIIIGAILGSLLLIALVLVALSLLKRRRRVRGDEETKAGIAGREHTPVEVLTDVRGSSGSDEVSRAYELTGGKMNDPENVQIAGMVQAGNAGGIDNPAFNRYDYHGTNRGDESRRNDLGSDSDDEDAMDYVNLRDPNGSVGQSSGTGLSESFGPPAIPRRFESQFERAAVPPKPSLTPRQAKAEPKPVPRSRKVGNAEEIILDGPARGTTPQTGMRDQSIYPFVSVGPGVADEANTAYQFTRVAGLETDEPTKAEKVYVAQPLQPPIATTQEGDSSSDEDDTDYEPVVNPNSIGNQIMGMMQTGTRSDAPAPSVKHNAAEPTAKRALQPPTPVSRETGRTPTVGGVRGGNNFLGELTNALSRPPLVSRDVSGLDGDSAGFGEDRGLSPGLPGGVSSVEDHDYDDAPLSGVPLGMADDEDEDSDKDDYEFVNDPNNSMGLGLDRPW